MDDFLISNRKFGPRQELSNSQYHPNTYDLRCVISSLMYQKHSLYSSTTSARVCKRHRRH